MPPRKKAAPAKKSARRDSAGSDSDSYDDPNEGKGQFDLTLPPLYKLDEIFSHMVSREAKELAALFKDLGRPLRVATMCSGTESPILALRLMSRALEAQTGVCAEIDHVFSAEIEPFKQAYIERNFAPPLLFRDVTELYVPSRTRSTTCSSPLSLSLTTSTLPCVQAQRQGSYGIRFVRRSTRQRRPLVRLYFAQARRCNSRLILTRARPPWQDCWYILRRLLKPQQ